MGDKQDCLVCTSNQDQIVHNFIQDRLGIIQENKFPTSLSSLPMCRLVLHLIPEKFQEITLDIKYMENPDYHLTPCGETSESIVADYNFDGICFYSSLHDKSAYVQLFRDGRIEMAAAIAQGFKHAGTSRGVISLIHLEKDLEKSLSNHLEILSKLSVKGPFYLYIRMFGLENIRLFPDDIAAGGYDAKGRNKAIIRNHYIFPRYKIEHVEVPLSEYMDPVFNILWNAFGFSCKPVLDFKSRV